MKRMMLLVTLAIFFVAITACAATTTQKFTSGWDNFAEPLNFTKSNLKWSVSATRKLTVTYTLVRATPTKLYQISINFFCSTFPATFGQFPTDLGGGACQSLTRQGMARDSPKIEVGAVLTDSHGNASFSVVIGPVLARMRSSSLYATVLDAT